MRTVALGRSAVAVTALGFGGGPIGNLYRAVDGETAAGAVSAAWRAGVRFFDTAPHYGLGLSERRLGRALAARPRDGYVLSTKVGRLLVPLAGGGGRDPGEFEVAATHRRVWDFSADGVRRSLRAAGSVGAIGAGMNQWRMLADLVRYTDLDVVLLAGRYTLLDQSALDVLLPLCTARGVSVIAAGVFNSGLLATDSPQPGATYDYAPGPPAVIERARRIAAVCGRHGVTLPQAALAFPTGHPAVATVLVGMRSAAEVARNADLASRAVPAALWAELVDEGLLRSDAPTPRQAAPGQAPSDPAAPGAVPPEAAG